MLDGGDEPLSMEWLTVDEVADRMRANAQTIRRAIRAGRLDAVNLGTKSRPFYRIHYQSLFPVDRREAVRSVPRRR